MSAEMTPATRRALEGMLTRDVTSDRDIHFASARVLVFLGFIRVVDRFPSGHVTYATTARGRRALRELAE